MDEHGAIGDHSRQHRCTDRKHLIAKTLYARRLEHQVARGADPGDHAIMEAAVSFHPVCPFHPRHGLCCVLVLMRSMRAVTMGC